MSEFPIQIDARELFYRFFIIPGVTPNFVDSREVQTLQLAPGIYNFQVASGLFADFTFTVKPDGNVDYDIDCDSFLKGRGTSTLTILGLEVTIEALRLTGADPARPDETGVLLANTPLTNEDWIAHRTVHIVPGKGYSVQPGSGLVGDFTFDLKRDGTFAYDPTMDSSQGGFLSGSGTSTLTFQGYPLTVDATAVSKLLIIQGVNNFPASNTGKATVVLLPAKGYSLQFVSGRVSDLIFSLGIDGVVNFEPSLAGFFNLEKQGEQVTLRVKGAPIQIDARELFYRFFIIPGVTPNFVDSREVQTLQLAPGIYNFQVASGLFADFTFTVKPDGNVGYDIDCDSFLKGRGTSTLTILGLEVTIDALRLTGADPARPDETGVLLANTPLTNEDWIALRTIRLLPTKGSGVIVGSALVASFTFDLKRDGTFDYDPALDSFQGGFLAGKGTNKLKFLGYPLTVDATAVSDLLIIPVRNFPASHTGKADAVLLPLNGYPMQLASGAPSNLSFNVELNGNISFDASLSDAFKLENQAGKPVLRVQDTTMSTLKFPFKDGLDHPGKAVVFEIVAGDSGTAIKGTSVGLESDPTAVGVGVIGFSNPIPQAPGLPVINKSVGVQGICEPLIFPTPTPGIPMDPQKLIGVLGQSPQGEAVVGQGGFGALGILGGRDRIFGKIVGVYGESGANGIVGKSNGAGAAVFGVAQNGEGVHGETSSVDVAGVAGISLNPAGKGSTGVFGKSNGAGAAVFGVAQNGEGVHGETSANSFVAGVTGIAMNKDGVGPGVLGQSNGSGPGVFGESIKNPGVMGFHGDPRLQETSVSNEAAKAGVFGASDIGAGVLGYSRDPGTPAVFAFGSFHAIALNKPLAGLFDGNVQVNGDIFLPGADCAEHFDVADVNILEPGTVMVINNNGILEQSVHAYDRKVAGVISGAGNHKTGIVLDKQASEENRKPIALIGKVNCKVDATYSPIEVGDLLTTSLTPGHAMKASEPQKAFGSIIGKALRGLREGQGLIPILIALQ